MASIAIEDLKEHQEQLMEEIRKVKDVEKKTFIDVINGTVNMPLPEYIDILNRSDAASSHMRRRNLQENLTGKNMVIMFELWVVDLRRVDCGCQIQEVSFMP